MFCCAFRSWMTQLSLESQAALNPSVPAPGSLGVRIVEVKEQLM
jgi:hypothetical protein